MTKKLQRTTASQQPSAPVRVIDVHTHPLFFDFGKTPTEINWLVKHCRGVGIEKAVGLGDVLLHGRHFTRNQIAEVNNVSARVQALHPDFFRFFCFLNPRLGEKAVMAEVERCVDQHGFVGIKLEICNNARDACMAAVMKAARRWNLPVLQHAWSQTNIRQRSFHSDPADVALLAKRYPDVTIIMPHLTGIGVRGVLEAKGLSNLYVDTSGGLAEEGLIAYAIEHLGVDHVLYGSDLPGRSAAVAIQRVIDAGLSESEQRMVLFENATRIVNLNGA